MELASKTLELHARRDSVAASIPPLSAGVAVLYLVLFVLHPFFLEGPSRWLMAALSLATSLVAGGIALIWRIHPRQESVRLAMSILAVLVLMNSTVHFALYPVPANTTNFIAFILGTGLVLLSRRWFLVFLAATFVCWGAVVVLGPVSNVAEWGWFLFFSSFVAIVLQEQRIHVTSAMARREATLRRNAEVLQSLMQTAEFSETNSNPFLEQLCFESWRHLGVGRSAIWLASGDKSTFRLAAEAGDSPVAAGAQRFVPSDADIAELLANRTIVRVGEGHAGSAPSADPVRLEAAILGQGRLVGVAVHEARSGSRHWTLEERAFVGSIADYAALALQTQQRAALERRALESERLESLGVLAGGVAHDFNNLLTVILGNADLIARRAAPGTRELRNVQAIEEAAQRARELAQQMLAYAGRARTSTQTVDLASLARDLDRDWAHDLLGDIRIEMDVSDDVIYAVDVDPTQIRQVLLNLLTNARDALASTLKIRVAERTVSPQEADSLTVEPGSYHQFTIEDDGQGMDPVTLGRIFDPFFTTRRSGSGLGLAAVLGILRSHHGTVLVESKFGEGSRFDLLLPASHHSPKPKETARPGGRMEALGSRVLVVEDQELVAETARSMLEGTGRIVSIMSGCAVVKENLAAVDLFKLEAAVVDLTLADGSGVDVIDRLRAGRPDLPIVLMSGYDARNAMASLRNSELVEFLSKPFDAQSLTEAIDVARTKIEGKAS